MEFSFDIPNWIKLFTEKPEYIVIWAAFGVFFSVFIIVILSSWIGKFLSINLDKVTIVLATTFMITWITGFISMIILLFTAVSGIKMLLIWFSIFFGYFIFSLINYNKIEQFSNDRDKERKKLIS